VTHARTHGGDGDPAASAPGLPGLGLRIGAVPPGRLNAGRNGQTAHALAHDGVPELVAAHPRLDQ
jgi:hypothetical protein